MRGRRSSSECSSRGIPKQPSINYLFLGLTFAGRRSYSSTSFVWMMVSCFLPLPSSVIPVIESSAGMPTRRGSRGELAGAFFAGPAALIFLGLDRAIVHSRLQANLLRVS
jgi:hypothetical protein